MADPKTNDRSDEMEHDLHKLEDHIVDAEKKLEARKEEAESVDDTAGDREGEQDRGGGDDPEGAAVDASEAAPGGSQDGPDASTTDADAADVDEERSNPT